MMRREILALVTVALLGANSLGGTYSGGTGEPNDPYRIATAEDLNDIGNHPNDWDKDFILIADIDLSVTTYTTAVVAPDINSENWVFDGTALSGTFDGNAHRIINLTIDTHTGSGDHLALFGAIDSGGQVKNLGLENVTITGGDESGYLGGLVAYNSGTISNCYSTGAVTGGDRSWDLGGLVAYNSGTISNCYSTGAVTGGDRSWNLGGLVGESGGRISDCHVTGSVTGGINVGGLVGIHWDYTIRDCRAEVVVQGSSKVGGLVGASWRSRISDCCATGTVTGLEEGSSKVGGLVGANDFCDIAGCYATGSVSGTTGVGGLVGVSTRGRLSECYARGSVTGTSWVGGLVGRDEYEIYACYATGAVTGEDYVGGLVGRSSSYIIDCYSTGTVSALASVGGLVGGGRSYIEASFWDTESSGMSTSAYGEGKTTAEMKKESTFSEAGWEFVEIWDIGDNQTYPFLRTHPAGDINHDDRVNYLDLAVLASHWLEGH